MTPPDPGAGYSETTRYNRIVGDGSVLGGRSSCSRFNLIWLLEAAHQVLCKGTMPVYSSRTHVSHKIAWSLLLVPGPLRRPTFSLRIRDPLPRFGTEHA